ncbi:MAG: acetylglutamate kinase [Oscillospiraceae bacterium]|jgi:acetylglutamate kinase|nr:acetylglutamate kinase [Oscillospiraceae bacterium]
MANNKINNNERARTLVEALPYIQKFAGKVVVIKYGGSAMMSPELFDAVIEDIVLLQLVGINVVLVHGGGPEINDLLGRLGIASRFIGGLRYTDKDAMEIVQGVLCGKVNKDLVAMILRKGGSAVGVCGLDAKLFEAKKMDKGDGVDYGFVGNIVNVNPGIVTEAIENGHIPVVATVAFGIDGDTSYNVNADTASAKLAVAIDAEKLILLTNTRGVLQVKNDESTLIKQIRPHEIEGLIKRNIIADGMIPKVECCAEAIAGGVRRTHILDGRIHHSILIEMLTNEGAGTMIFSDTENRELFL